MHQNAPLPDKKILRGGGTASSSDPTSILTFPFLFIYDSNTEKSCEYKDCGD